MNSLSNLPIGVFDSGLGGLTVVKALTQELPHENIIYVGDTARVPYGTKSQETVRRYALQISFYLLQKKVKMIVVACNTVSAVALKALQSLPIPVIGVIDPGARAAVLKTGSLKVGVIGTPATISSHAYRAAIKKYSPRTQVWEAACPLFVPLVEEGWLNNFVTKQIAQIYLRPLLKNKIDTLVLGCTHYPLLKETLKSVSGKRVQLIDSASATAQEVKNLLLRSHHLNSSPKKGTVACYVTDNPASFSHVGGPFLGDGAKAAPRVSVRRLHLENI
jgi:glutamate racemase